MLTGDQLDNIIRVKLEEAHGDPIFSNLRSEIITALWRYVVWGIPTGSFLTAILENDLVSAVRCADRFHSLSLHVVLNYVLRELPPSCWGSAAAVQDWVRSKAEESHDQH